MSPKFLNNIYLHHQKKIGRTWKSKSNLRPSIFFPCTFIFLFIYSHVHTLFGSFLPMLFFKHLKQVKYSYSFFSLVDGTGVWIRTPCLLRRLSINWTTPLAFFCNEFFQDRVSRTICPGWLQTMILLISTSRVPRIIDVNPHCLAHVILLIDTTHNPVRLLPSFYRKNNRGIEYLVVFQDHESGMPRSWNSNPPSLFAECLLLITFLFYIWKIRLVLDFSSVSLEAGDSQVSFPKSAFVCQ
jgi:hypothetical protein